MNDPTPPAPARRLHVGDPAPWFVADCTSNAAYHFDTVAGRTVVLSFLGTSAEPRVAHAARVMEFMRARPPRPSGAAAVEAHAPVLVIPRVFEPKLCADLIAWYERDGDKDSGYMQEREGFTVPVIDHRHKRRRDAEIADEGLKNAAMRRVKQRIAPEIARAFAFDATRIERHIVACYDGSEGGWFRPHRDNTTRGTAHRRFAVTLNLNGDYDGGDLRFPEFGQRTYRAPPGGAVVFSCSLLHEATPVTRGRRFAYLPFLYDEAAARVREANQGFLKHDVVNEVP